MTVAALAAAIRRGELSPREAVQEALERIERDDPAYNAFITVRGEDRSLSVIQYANNNTFNPTSTTHRAMFGERGVAHGSAERAGLMLVIAQHHRRRQAKTFMVGAQVAGQP